LTEQAVRLGLEQTQVLGASQEGVASVFRIEARNSKCHAKEFYKIQGHCCNELECLNPFIKFKRIYSFVLSISCCLCWVNNLKSVKMDIRGAVLSVLSALDCSCHAMATEMSMSEHGGKEGSSVRRSLKVF
jgi:hypothetical protein